MLWRRLSRFERYDNFGIYDELRYMTIISVIFVIVFNIEIGISTVYELDMWYIQGTTAAIYSCIVMYLNVPHVSRMYKKQEKLHEYSSFMTTDARSPSRSRASSTNSETNQTNQTNLTGNTGNYNARHTGQIKQTIAEITVVRATDTHNIKYMQSWKQIVSSPFGFEVCS